MPKQLNDLKVHEVSVVDRPANMRPFLLMKSEDGGITIKADGETPMKSEADGKHPASDYAYVPDPEKPSTWKLRIDDVKHVGAAAAALGPGYRGQKVQIPASDRDKVRANVRAAWRRLNPDKDSSEMPEVLRKSSVMGRLIKWFGMAVADDDDEPGALSFDDALARDDAMRADCEQDSHLWKLTNALWEAIDSIADDDTLTDKAGAAQECLTQFFTALKESGLLASDTGEGDSMTFAQRFRKFWSDEIEKTKKDGDVAVDADDDGVEGNKKDFRPMTYSDKDKGKKKDEGAEKDFTPVSMSKAEDIQKRFEDLEKAAKDATERAERAENLAKAEMEKSRTREFLAKAQSLGNIPGKSDELASLLKSLDDANPALFKSVHALLDSLNNVVGQSDLFKEFGSSGPTSGDIGADVEAIAKSMVEKGTARTIEEGIMKAYDANPALYGRHRSESRQ